MSLHPTAGVIERLRELAKEPPRAGDESTSGLPRDWMIFNPRRGYYRARCNGFTDNVHLAGRFTYAFAAQECADIPSLELRPVPPSARISGWNIAAFALALHTPRPLRDWREENGNVLWWTFPVIDAPFCGTPSDLYWPLRATHWTPLPEADLVTGLL